MTRLVAISSSQHANHTYISRDAYRFTRGQNIAPVVLAELSKVISHYPIGFVAEKDHYLAVALIGYDKQNLYVNDDGIWLGNYVPSVFRGYPFALATNDDGKRVFCIFEDHLSQEAASQPLFAESGELTDDVKNHLDFLTQRDTNRQQTQTATDALQAKNLFVPWELTIADAKEKPLRINGLYRIDEATLNCLPAENFTGLRTSGALVLAYAQMFSMSQHIQLTYRLKYHAQVKNRTTEVSEEDIARVFAKNDDILKFDF